MRLSSLLVSVAFCTLVCGSISAQQSPADPLIIVKNGRYGFIDRSGTIVIAPAFVWANVFDEGMAAVYVCDKMISIDSAGQPHPLRTAKTGELAPKKMDGKYVLVNSSDQLVTQSLYDEVGFWSDGAMPVKRDGKWGYVDRNGREFIHLRFDEAYPFMSGVANSEISSEPVIINKKGEIIYRGAPFLQGVADERIAMINGEEKAGFLDLSGNVVIPFIYDSTGSFDEGLAPVRKGNKWGYIDKSGKLVIPFKFDEAHEFMRGLADARSGTTSGFINRSGNFVFSLNYRGTSGFMFGDVARFWTVDDKFGYVNTSGKVIWGPTPEMPDHWPLLGMSEGYKKASCEGLPESFKERVLSFPSED
jgi:hypothetical protein